MRTTRTPRLGQLLILVPVLVPVLAAGCGSQSTTGKTVTLHTRLDTDLAADHTFTTDVGWTVTVKTLLAASGAFYYFDGEPAFTMAPRRSRGAAPSTCCPPSGRPGRTRATTSPATRAARC